MMVGDLHDQVSASVTPRKGESPVSGGLPSLSTGRWRMPPELMERQLSLQNPLMLRIQRYVVKDSAALENWRFLEMSLTHKRGVWSSLDKNEAGVYDVSNSAEKKNSGTVSLYELDDTEGPLRMRLRLNPTRFGQRTYSIEKGSGPGKSGEEPLLNAAILLKLEEDETVLHSCQCSVIHPYEKRPGELVLTSSRIAFVDAPAREESEDSAAAGGEFP